MVAQRIPTAMKQGGRCENCWRGFVEMPSRIWIELIIQMQNEKCSMMKVRMILGAASCNFCYGLSGRMCGRTSGKTDTVRV